MLNEKIIEEFLDDIQISIVSSINKEGFPIARAMLPPREREGINIFYFSTNTSSNKIKEYKENPKASLYFFNSHTFKGLLITGTMELLNDKESKERIWEDGDELYYPKGIEDEDYIVMKFTGNEFRFYSGFKTETFTLK